MNVNVDMDMVQLRLERNRLKAEKVTLQRMVAELQGASDAAPFNMVCDALGYYEKYLGFGTQRPGPKELIRLIKQERADAEGLRERVEILTQSLTYLRQFHHRDAQGVIDEALRLLEKEQADA